MSSLCCSCDALCSLCVVASEHLPVWRSPLQLSELLFSPQFLLFTISFCAIDIWNLQINQVIDGSTFFWCLLWHQTKDLDWSGAPCRQRSKRLLNFQTHQNGLIFGCEFTLFTFDLSLSWQLLSHWSVALCCDSKWKQHSSPVGRHWEARPAIRHQSLLPRGPTASGKATRITETITCLGSVCGAYRPRLPLHSRLRQALRPRSHSCSTSVPQSSLEQPGKDTGYLWSRSSCDHLNFGAR